MQANYSTATVLKSVETKVNGKPVTVEALLGRNHRQDIAYRVNGVVVPQLSAKLFNRLQKARA